MKTLRTVFGICDDLQRYADAFVLERTGVLCAAADMRDAGTAQVAVLALEPPFQVELCVVRPGAAIPEHVHPHADTIEVTVAGAVRLFVNDVDPFAFVPNDRLARFVRGRGIRINRSDRHGGWALRDGAMFLSIQRWDGAPRSVLTDYEGEAISDAHRQLREATCN